MENKIRNLGALLVASWFSRLPVTQALSSDQASDSTFTVVILVLLLILLCVALILAWKRLIHTEGGEVYHPQELWRRAQDSMQNVTTKWSHGEQEEDSTVEDNLDEEEEAKEEEPDITAL